MNDIKRSTPNLPPDAESTRGSSLLLRMLGVVGPRLRRSPLARIPLVNRLHGKLTARLYGKNEVKVGPFRVFIDARDRVIAKKLILYGAYEEGEISVLCSLVHQGDQVMDVGANIGIYSLYLSRAVGPTGKVIAVEPDPDNLVLLRKNLDVNGCDNVVVVPFALGSESGQVGLFQTDDNRGNLSLADLGNTGRSISVRMRRGDQLIEELGLAPRVAKIDVEGAEPSVIAGLGDRKPEILLFEFVPGHLRAQEQDPRQFLEALSAEGYVLHQVDAEGKRRLPAAAGSILKAAEQPNANLNVLAMR